MLHHLACHRQDLCAAPVRPAADAQSRMARAADMAHLTSVSDAALSRNLLRVPNNDHDERVLLFRDRRQPTLAVVLIGQVRSLTSPSMQAMLAAGLRKLSTMFADVTVVASLELRSDAVSNSRAKLNIQKYRGRSTTRMQWVGSNHSKASVLALLQRLGVPFSLSLVDEETLGRDIQKMVDDELRAACGQHRMSSSSNRTIDLGFDPHAHARHLGLTWWKWALGYRHLLDVERRRGGKGKKFDFLLKLRPDKCLPGLQHFDERVLSAILARPHVAWLDTDQSALLPRYAAPFYFRWAMQQCLDGPFSNHTSIAASRIHGGSAPSSSNPPIKVNTVDAHMAAHGVPTVPTVLDRHLRWSSVGLGDGLLQPTHRLGGLVTDETRREERAVLRPLTFGCLVRTVVPTSHDAGAAVRGGRLFDTCSWDTWNGGGSCRQCAPRVCTR